MALTDLLKSFTRASAFGIALYACGGSGEDKQGCQDDYDCREPRVCVQGYCEGGNGSNNSDSDEGARIGKGDNNNSNENNNNNNLPNLTGRIVFASDIDTQQGDEFGLTELYSINADGSNRRRLTNNSAMDVYPNWSPDGEKIVFSSGRGGNTRKIYVMNADGSNQTRLSSSDSQQYNDDEPSWSPDGRKIAFISDPENERFNIYIMNSDGSNRQNLTNAQQGDDLKPSWSPDGNEIVFESSRAGYNDIYKMNSDGSNVQRLTNDGQNQDNTSEPNWFPGRKIVFTSTREGNNTIYTMDSDGSNQRRIGLVDYSARLDPCWSPDENYVAFAYGTGQIRIIPADGTGEEQVLARGGRRNATPSWGTD